VSEATSHPKDVKGVAGVGGKSKVSSCTSKPRTAPPKTNASGRKRLRPGKLDGLVLAQMRKSEEELPITPGSIASAIGRSSVQWATVWSGWQKRRRFVAPRSRPGPMT
jgi:hypothetical protein